MRYNIASLQFNLPITLSSNSISNSYFFTRCKHRIAELTPFDFAQENRIRTRPIVNQLITELSHQLSGTLSNRRIVELIKLIA